jgi:hypothetical protein
MSEDHTLVVKVAIKHRNGTLNKQNQREWEIWEIVKNTKFEQYFCPCVEVIDNYEFLIAKKANPISNSVCLPNDFKLSKGFELLNDCDIENKGNSGELNGKIILIDYGHYKFLEFIKMLELQKQNK